jgi:hypothetical protein
MLDTPTLQCNRVSFCRSAVVQNRQKILEFASIGHGASPVFDHRPANFRRSAVLDHDHNLLSEDRIVHLHVWSVARASTIWPRESVGMKKNLHPDMLRLV